MNKKFVIINAFLIFAVGFLVHGMYEWFPCTITTIFPVNESLYEHIKLIFLSPMIASTILYFIYRYKKKKINNFVTGLYLSTMFNIIVYYLIYIPIYKMIGSNMVFTLIWYFISIGISQYINYLIISRKNNSNYNKASILLILMTITILTYFTYHPLKTEFFRDPENNYYGIKNKK